MGRRLTRARRDLRPSGRPLARKEPSFRPESACAFACVSPRAQVWGGALRMVWVYHITWAVNSVSHVWGTQTYNTGDLSRNNWPIGILAWGEGWCVRCRVAD